MVALKLKVERLTKRFGGLTAVRDVSFEVRDQEILGIIGPNGAGKTTLFHLISGFERPDAGRVFLEGQDITGKSPEAISRLGLTRTFQLVKPFGKMTVLENVCVGAFLRRSDLTDARAVAEDVVELVGLKPFADQPAATLPIGHRKRLELARALATEPKILLLDEVMGGLTPAEIGQMIDTIRRLREGGLTIVIIEHHMRAIMSLSDRVVVMHQGEKIAEGTPKEIAQDSRVIEAYFGGELRFA
ncbi:hypothetical protein TR75_12830 [Hydrogenibacillus schlegelii]|uniref:ABC transporter ATP-binding protein n=1 Tax=Hydrogenibacillus schlegelii TaxID=1484 RepID=A0A132MFW4_HYDSH|nr:hypothetical protein TR75_12830 [Hydrogenibacillus schlegelii]OAR04853.1 ABC transporter ATP-binding protein [Hydrogenibacillus schlegelii]